MTSHLSYEEQFLSSIQSKNEEHLLQLLILFTYTSDFIESCFPSLIEHDLARVVEKILFLDSTHPKIHHSWVSHTVNSGSVNVLRFFLKHGGELEHLDPVLRDVAVYWASAAKSGNPAMVDFMITHFDRGMFAIKRIFYSALSYKNLEMAKYILTRYLPSPSLKFLLGAINFQRNNFKIIQFFSEEHLITSRNSSDFIYALNLIYGYNPYYPDCNLQIIKALKLLFLHYLPENFDWEKYTSSLQCTDLEYLTFLIPFFQNLPNSTQIFTKFLTKQHSMNNFAFIFYVESTYDIHFLNEDQLLHAAIHLCNSDLLDEYIPFASLDALHLKNLLCQIGNTPNTLYFQKLLSLNIDLTEYHPDLLKSVIHGGNFENLKILFSKNPDLIIGGDSISYVLSSRNFDVADFLLDHGASLSQLPNRIAQELFHRNRPKIIKALLAEKDDWGIFPSDILYNAVDGLSIDTIKLIIDHYNLSQDDINRSLIHLLNIERNFDDAGPSGLESPEVFFLSMFFHKDDPNNTPYPKTIEILVNAGADLDLFTQKEIRKIIKRKLWRTVQFLFEIRNQWEWDLIALFETAFSHSQDRIVELLFSYGSFTADSLTHICSHAIKWKQYQWIAFFQNQKMNLHLLRHNYNLLLTQALLAQNIEFLHYLLNKGVNPENFQIPLDQWILITQNAEIMTVLKEFGYKHTIKNENSAGKFLL